MTGPEQAGQEELTRSARKLFESASGDNPPQRIKDFWQLIERGVIEITLMTWEEEQEIYRTDMTVDHKTSEEAKTKVFVKVGPAIASTNLEGLGQFRREALFSDCNNNMIRAVVHYLELGRTGARF